MFRPLTIALSALLAAGCTHLETRASAVSPEPQSAAAPNNAYASRYQPIASAPVLITGATVLIGNGQRLDNADVLVENGQISAVGPQLQAPANAVRVDGRGKWVTSKNSFFSDNYISNIICRMQRDQNLLQTSI